ncbi:DnaB-like helicase C-terminal domain-containing protein [Clostridium magnum]|uniref:DnaB-like helicase C-terminal domain-containing protein n=1 Tax=Clostridium magnum TaxID=33954 RepID=UPI001114DF6C
MKNASLSEEQWHQISKEASNLANSPIKIYNKIFTLNNIAAECRKLKIKEGLCLVIINKLSFKCKMYSPDYCCYCNL